MNLSNLQPAEGATHNQNKRLGRGEGSRSEEHTSEPSHTLASRMPSSA